MGGPSLVHFGARDVIYGFFMPGRSSRRRGTHRCSVETVSGNWDELLYFASSSTVR